LFSSLSLLSLSLSPELVVEKLNAFAFGSITFMGFILAFEAILPILLSERMLGWEQQASIEFGESLLYDFCSSNRMADAMSKALETPFASSL
jgi:hypothetical protein